MHMHHGIVAQTIATCLPLLADVAASSNRQAAPGLLSQLANFFMTAVCPSGINSLLRTSAYCPCHLPAWPCVCSSLLSPTCCASTKATRPWHLQWLLKAASAPISRQTAAALFGASPSRPCVRFMNSNPQPPTKIAPVTW